MHLMLLKFALGIVGIQKCVLMKNPGKFPLVKEQKENVLLGIPSFIIVSFLEQRSVSNVSKLN